ncbi:uncharacterized protein YqgQ [Cytobacillus horneckiae]|uniref:DUF910 domain-containing protein n=1 Tax=Cytobacillus horneckiae TaxID=549687 RepID=A0A2N0ZHB6_9BACI|nr:YqgQ family protein [Cytobacillus horneckiae]NRG44720.1 YqgQ family protein [Bacillus sp. CRN 9]MBN6888862.1 YqgQ family protein [Cytobacillus horneckiae]MCM3179957.1 YqgQ family protein [Cytobacillus horneckiae]MEC1155346.1 YqgQ family protein [Cytobacillus horneckiae]MED2936601.1 YqgQ family protein [Cytobacillus horneckiae]
MKTVYDVQQLLKKYGAIIYMGERLLDLEMMEKEIVELYKAQLLDSITYRDVVLLLRSEMQKEREKKK